MKTDKDKTREQLLAELDSLRKKNKEQEVRLYALGKELESHHQLLISREKALNQCEEKFRSYISNAPNGIFVVDEKGNYLEVNETAENITGYSKDELLNMNLIDLIQTGEHEKAENHFKTVIKTGKATGELAFIKKDGVSGYWNINAVKLKDNRFLGMVTDITGLMKAEEELINSNRLFDLFFHRSMEGFFFMMLDEPVEWNDRIDKEEVLDYVFLKQRITKINSAMLQQYGAKKEDFINLTPGDLFSHDLKHGKEVWRKFFDEGKLLIDTTEKKLDGSYMVISGSYTCLYDNKGRITGHFGVQRDITEERKTKETLQKSEAIKKTMVSNIGDVIVIIDQNGINQYKSPNITKLFGWTPEDLLGKSTWDNIHSDDLEAAQRFLGNIAAESNATGTTELRYRRKDGRYVWIEITVSNLLHDKDIQGILGNYHDISERKQAEEALKESEEKFRALYDNAPLSYQSLNEDGSFKDVNPTWLRTLGYERDEVIGKFYKDFLHPDYKSHFEKNFPAFKKRGYVHDVQFKIRHKEGYYLDISFEGCVGYKPDGSFKQTYCVFQDITERKDAEEALKESEERFELAVNASNDGLFDWNLKTNAIYYSPGWKKMIGYEDHELPNDFSVWEKTTAPEDVKKSWELQQKLISKQIDRFVLEFKMKHKDGHWVEILSRAKAIFDDNGKAIRMVGTHTDITESKHLAESLAESEAKFRALFERGPIGVAYHEMVYDDSGKPVDYRFLDANASYIELTGVDPRGKSVTEAFPGIENDPFDWIGTFGRVARTGEKIRFEQYLKTNNRWYDCVGYQVKPDHFVAAFVEITKRKQAEKEKLELQEQLHHKSKMDSIGQLAGGMAHDFNNVLSGILNASELLKSPELGLNDNSLKYVDMIIRASVRASDLIRKLLAFSRKGKIVTSTINMHEILHETIGLLKGTVDKKVTISLSEEAHNQNFIGDFAAIESVFLNLGINASHAMPGGGEIIISTKNTYLDRDFCDSSSFEIVSGDYIQISIKDSGCGIPEENLQKIFDPFFTTKEQGKGTGLGLSAVYGTIQDHHGVIEVKSELDSGTTFDIWLPCSETSSEPTEEKPQILSGTGTILFVDDEEMNRTLNTVILKNLGYQVILAEDGAESVEIFRKKHSEIDIVIMDMIMPRMNGSEAFYKMKEIDENCNVIIVSGYTKDEKIDELIKAGVKEFINKPYKISEISRLIDRIVCK